jgi:hypothetical protein
MIYTARNDRKIEDRNDASPFHAMPCHDQEERSFRAKVRTMLFIRDYGTRYGASRDSHAPKTREIKVKERTALAICDQTCGGMFPAMASKTSDFSSVVVCIHL